jgi:K+-transporting ATPase KdpF subunit
LPTVNGEKQAATELRTSRMLWQFWGTIHTTTTQAGVSLKTFSRRYINESHSLAASNVLAGTRDYDPLLRLHRRMRENLKGKLTMIYLTAAVSLFLFVYLFAALIRPEWF